ncbi:MAG: preprotein translocase subunit SecE [Malacoplasma sp.]|nr:preprotein translocase subunit SecE [Malacoplasma sp.]
MTEQEKQQKAEHRRKAKEERQRIFNEVASKKKSMKDERDRLLNLYAQKEIELKNKYHQDLTAAGNNKEQIKTVKQEFEDTLFDLHNQRDYEVAKYYLSEKTRNREKMKVDKRIAYREYYKQYEILKNSLATSLDVLKKEHKQNIEDLKKKYMVRPARSAMKQYKTEVAPFKKEYEIHLAAAKSDYKTSIASIKHNKYTASEQAHLFDQAREDYENKLKTVNETYDKHCSEIRTKLNMSYDPKLYSDKLIDENNAYEEKYIRAKVEFKNKDLQLKQKRDLSYEYELDSGYTMRRWFYGVGKEFQRMSWPGPKKTIRDLLIVVAITIFLALLCLVIDVIFNATGIMK